MNKCYHLTVSIRTYHTFVSNHLCSTLNFLIVLFKVNTMQAAVDKCGNERYKKIFANLIERVKLGDLVNDVDLPELAIKFVFKSPTNTDY